MVTIHTEMSEDHGGARPLTPDLLSVDEARDRILAAFEPLEPIEVPAIDALGLVLAEDVVSMATLPPRANAAMDGFALQSADTVGASPLEPVRLRVIGEVAAGYQAAIHVEPGTSVRIMTGAPIPAGADAVVRFEETDEVVSPIVTSGRRATIGIHRAARRGDNIRPDGEDVRAGDLVLQRGARLRPAEIGLLAAIGQTTVTVHRRPRVAILATGDEIVDPETTPGPGQIRNSNGMLVAALTQRCGGEVVMRDIVRDSVADLRDKLRAAGAADLVVTTGGVSVGDYDLVKDVLRIEGDIALWQVRIKPGKPLAFGRVGGVPLLGLPGNPVAAAVAFEQFARPAIYKMVGRSDLSIPTVTARLADRVENRGDRRHYVRVRVDATADGYVASLTGAQGTGILTSLVRADGLLIIPEDVPVAEPGMSLQVQMLDWNLS